MRKTLLQQYKLPALISNELSASLTFGAFASPDELAKTLNDSLSSEAVATLTPFVLAKPGRQPWLRLRPAPPASQVLRPHRMPLEPLMTSQVGQIHFRQSCLPPSLSRSSLGSRVLILVTFWTIPIHPPVDFWHFATNTWQTSPSNTFHGICGYLRRPKKNFHYIGPARCRGWKICYGTTSHRVTSLPMAYPKCSSFICWNWFPLHMPCWKLPICHPLGSTTSCSFHLHFASIKPMLVSAILRFLSCSKQTVQLGRPLATFAFAAGL